MTKTSPNLTKPRKVKKTKDLTVKNPDDLHLKAKHIKLLNFMENLTRTNGNLTEAALLTVKCKNRPVARELGSKMFREAKELGLYRIFLEEKGYTLGRLIEIAAEKMEGSKKPDWWDRIMKMAGYEDFISKKSTKSTPIHVSVFGEHDKLASEYMIDEEIE